MTELILNIPDNLYQKLIQKAKNQGETLEDITLNYLTQMTIETKEDPLDKFIGAFDSNNSDWLENHDYYLGSSHLESVD